MFDYIKTKKKKEEKSNFKESTRKLLYNFEQTQ